MMEDTSLRERIGALRDLGSRIRSLADHASTMRRSVEIVTESLEI